MIIVKPAFAELTLLQRQRRAGKVSADEISRMNTLDIVNVFLLNTLKLRHLYNHDAWEFLTEGPQNDDIWHPLIKFLYAKTLTIGAINPEPHLLARKAAVDLANIIADILVAHSETPINEALEYLGADKERIA